ncbi:MAG: hypothetical protein AAB839_01945 [Patescibacteria group bacterium]
MHDRSTKALIIGALLALLAPASAMAFDPNYIISDSELTDENAMDLSQIQSFLERGTLSDYKTTDWEGRTRYASEIIWRAAQQHLINPRFILVLLQKEQSLVEDPDPTQKQLDWATGYAVCDSCSMNDGSLARWQGFGKQVNSAAMQFTEGYMVDIEEYGVTAGKYGPHVSVEIDDTIVTPENAATAAMYAYTPHLHGNENFVKIWDRWFGKEYPTGTLLQAAGEDGVYRIEHGYRRPITSQSALTSRYNKDLIITVSRTVVDSYPEGTPISLPNYSLVKDEDGNIYLLVDDTMRHISSMEAFHNIGYSKDELIDITAEEVATYVQGTPVTASTQDPLGKIVKLSTNGAMFYLKDGFRQAILDPAILVANFPNAPVATAQPVEIEQYREGKFLKLPDGTLVRSYDNPAVYVVSDGEKHPILSESIFTEYGYNWSNIIFVNDDVLELHATGNELGSSES